MLDNYARSCASEDCIVEMLDCWLRNFAGQPTWKDVAGILRLIGLHQLALEIESVYSTGNITENIVIHLSCITFIWPWSGIRIEGSSTSEPP